MSDSLFQYVHRAGHVVFDDGEVNSPNFVVFIEEGIEFGDGAKTQVHPTVAILFLVVFRVPLKEGQHPKVAGDQPLVAH